MSATTATASWEMACPPRRAPRDSTRNELPHAASAPEPRWRWQENGRTRPCLAAPRQARRAAARAHHSRLAGYDEQLLAGQHRQAQHPPAQVPRAAPLRLVLDLLAQLEQTRDRDEGIEQQQPGMLRLEPREVERLHREAGLVHHRVQEREIHGVDVISVEIVRLEVPAGAAANELVRAGEEELQPRVQAMDVGGAEDQVAA